MSDRLAVLPQYLIPKQAITMLAGKLASAQAGGLTTSVSRWFVGRYGVNMAEAANPDIASYKSFNEFFTRPLQEGARPLAAADFISPMTACLLVTYGARPPAPTRPATDDVMRIAPPPRLAIAGAAARIEATPGSVVRIWPSVSESNAPISRSIASMSSRRRR